MGEHTAWCPGASGAALRPGQGLVLRWWAPRRQGGPQVARPPPALAYWPQTAVLQVPATPPRHRDLPQKRARIRAAVLL